MSARITPKGSRVLTEILSYMVASGGIAPTFQEIGLRVGIKSKSVVSYHLRLLREAGFISTGDPYAQRSIRVIGSTWTPPADLAHLVAGAEGEVAA